MNKISKILIVLLSAAVVVLGTALFLQLGRTPVVSDQSVQGTSIEDDGVEKAETPEETADLHCSVQSGALRIVRGETFGVSKGSAACDAYFEDGVYTISAASTGEPIVVTVPQETNFKCVTLEASGGDLDVEDLDVEELSVTCGQGTLRFSGSVSADVEVEHTQGETVLQLDGDPTSFNYELTYESGHIQIGEQSYAGAHGSQSIDNGCEKTVRVHCAMGNVDIVFPEAS